MRSPISSSHNRSSCSSFRFLTTPSFNRMSESCSNKKDALNGISGKSRHLGIPSLGEELVPVIIFPAKVTISLTSSRCGCTASKADFFRTMLSVMSLRIELI